MFVFFWVIPRRLIYICRRFGTLYLFHLQRQVCLPLKMEQIECSETSAYINQTPGNHPKENKLHFPSSILFMIYLSLHIPANNHAVPFLSYLVQHSVHDILPQLRRIPTVSLNIEIQCYPTFLPHIIPTQLRKLSSYLWTNISVPCYQSASCIISHRVTAVSSSRSSLNLWSPRFGRSDLGDEFSGYNHNQFTLS